MTAHIIIDINKPVTHTPDTLEKELAEQGITGKIWVGIHDPASVVRSINLSHKMIVAYAKEQGLPEICIMEEDVMFLAPGAWQHFLDNRPKYFDLYLAGCYGLNQEAYKRIAEGNGATRINNFAGLHCYIINETYYDKFLDMPEDMHIDNQPGMGVFYVCSPFAALQHPGYSANNRVKVNYNSKILKDAPQNCLLSWERIKENH